VHKIIFIVDINVLLLRTLDFELDEQDCVAEIRLSDGKIISEPLTLTLSVGDVNEPPVWRSNVYTVITEEPLVGLWKSISMFKVLSIFLFNDSFFA